MKYGEIIKEIQKLARGQGFYCRVLRDLYDIEQNDKERFELIKKELEKQNFKETLDIVFYFEC